MNKEFVPYNLAIQLKELEFDESCFGYYNTTGSKQNELLFPQYAGELENWNEMTHLCSAPLYQQAFRWFREKYNIISSTRTHFNEEFFYEIYVDAMNEITSGYYNTYEEAELACIIKLIDIVKDKKD
jgi:hypothetical protein